MLSGSASKSIATLSAIAVVALVIALIPEQRGEEPIVVFAAASLRRPLEAIAPEFRQLVGHQVEYRFGGSEAMLNQIRLSQAKQPADLYIPADESYFLNSGDLVSQRFPLATMRAVLLVQPRRRGELRSFSDLLSPSTRLALAQPDIAAIGRITRDVLREQNQWHVLEKLIVVTPDNVVQSATAVELGSVDAAIVWDAVAVGFPKCEQVQLPELDRVTARVEVGLLKHSRHPEAALKFSRYLSEESGGAGHFRRLGFRAVEGTR